MLWAEISIMIDLTENIIIVMKPAFVGDNHIWSHLLAIYTVHLATYETKKFNTI